METVEVYFNGEFDTTVPYDWTVEQVTDAYHNMLVNEGYDMSGDYKVLEVVLDDEGWTVWYE